MEISIVIPAYNEAERIGATVQALIPFASEVIVVDDGSVDHTAKLAAEAGANVIRLKFNQGKGAALNTGLKAAKGEIILFLDADLGHTAAEAQKLLEPIVNGSADMAIAAFPPAKRKGGFGLVLGLARWGLRVFTGQTYRSPLSGQRAIRREVLKALGDKVAPGFGVELALTIDVARNGFKIIEVPTTMTHAETGRDLAGFCHRGKQFIAVARVLITQILRGGSRRHG